MKNVLIFITIILFFYTKENSPQNWISFTTSNSGLPSNEITSITPTANGEYWIGTNEGIAVFDWNSWEVIDSTNSILPTNFILAIEEDTKGGIWIGAGRYEWATDTIGGLIHYNGNNWQLYTVNNSSLAGSFNNILEAAPDSSIWIFTWPGTLSGYGITQNFDGENWFTLPWQISEFSANEFKVDQQNILWIGAFFKGLGKYDGNQLIFYGSENWGQTCSYVKDLAIDEVGNKWLAVNCWPQKGIVKYDDNDFTLYEMPVSPPPSDVLTSIEVDKLGNIWVGTYQYGLAKFDGQNWEFFDTTNSSLPDNWIRYISVDQFNNIWFRSGNTLTVFNENGIITPVELISFTGQLEYDLITLSWITATELNNQGFEIERKTTNEWDKIGFVNGNGTTTEMQYYSFTDNIRLVDNVDKIYYRLKQIDFDGTYEYSNEVAIEISQPNSYLLKQNYPNPFNPSTMIKYALGSRQYATLKVYDVLGNEVATLVNEERPAGEYEVEFYPASNIRNLVSGIYFYQLRAGLKQKKCFF